MSLAFATGDEELRAAREAYRHATSNPKELEGAKKPARCHVPSTSLDALHAAHSNGALKYGHFNWREEGVDVCTYLSACERHIEAFKAALCAAHKSRLALTDVQPVADGVNEVDPVTGIEVPHLGAAMACLSILHDAMVQGKLIDNYSVPEVLEKVGGKVSNVTSAASKDAESRLRAYINEIATADGLLPGDVADLLDPRELTRTDEHSQIEDAPKGD